MGECATTHAHIRSPRTSSGRGMPGGLLRPAPNSALWHVVYRFDSAEHLEAWERSDVRAELLARGAAFMEAVAVGRLDGMDAWFAPTPAPGAPARWKTFLMTATVIVVLQTLLSTLLRPLVGDWPTGASLAVPLLTTRCLPGGQGFLPIRGRVADRDDESQRRFGPAH
jgi:antibiotic biosynthesis monooxygenase (ABM) superfamily enzyme